MLTSSTSQPTTARRARRRNRWGGLVMSPNTAGAWASRIFGRELHPLRNVHTICKVISNHVRSYRLNFMVIGEVWPDEAQYMLITQSASFDGFKGMDPSTIPQFEEGDREAIARDLLEREGALGHRLGLNRMSDTILAVKEYRFITFLHD